MEKRYTATLSRSQGRSAWAVIFRHPVRVDPNTGRRGLRVRQGLGTSDDGEANELKDQLNELLAEQKFWSLPARAEAESRFHRRVVEIFYYGMEPEEIDFSAVREDVIPLPASTDSDYRSALLLGTTGAGKTTLLRQLIGTDPKAERFPSTAPGKTTVHETEVLLTPGDFKAVVTFFPIDEVREHLNECISEAVVSAYRGDDDNEMLRKLLMHVNQRFRFNYVLGNGPVAEDEDDQEDEDDDDDEEEALGEPTEEPGIDSAIDLDATNALLTSLGLTYKPGVNKEHWKRVWALSRRLGTPGLGDEYDNLKPVADLRKQLQDRLYVLLQNPLKWDPVEPTDDDQKQQVFDGLANALSVKTLDLATRRVRAERMSEWQLAFNQSGRGSSFARASIIGEQIYDRAAPVPDLTPSPDRNSFLHEVASVVDAVCQEAGAVLT
jgi:energy-coupling factor transporter ATP-binding protein EcfA2